MKERLPASVAVIRLHLWMERGGGTMLGLGRLQLLERIAHSGSIKAAADQLGMSYRAAWGKLKASEEALGIALVEKVGGNKCGCRLTPEGHALAETFRLWFGEVERHAVDRANALFPFLCDAFAERPGAGRPDATPSCVSQNIAK